MRQDFRGRFYDKALGRFTQADTLTSGGPQRLNRYAYVGNNPINFSDPSGHMQCNDLVMGTCVNEGGANGGSGGEETPPVLTPQPPTPDPCQIDPGLPICHSIPSVQDNKNSQNFGPGYVGPIPEKVKKTLISQGADAKLINNVTIHNEPGGGCQLGYAATTVYNNIYFCDPKYFDPAMPNEWLVHELIHVRQYRDWGPIPIIENLPVKMYETINHLLGGKYDPYKSFWVEVEAANCQIAYSGDPGIQLDQLPCMLK